MSFITELCEAFFTLIGIFTVVNWFRSSKYPMDSSNRFNRIVIWWLATTKPHLFAGSWAIFRLDAEDQVRAMGKVDPE